jgi:hypothetical protein
MKESLATISMASFFSRKIFIGEASNPSSVAMRTLAPRVCCGKVLQEKERVTKLNPKHESGITTVSRKKGGFIYYVKKY